MSFIYICVWVCKNGVFTGKWDFTLKQQQQQQKLPEIIYCKSEQSGMKLSETKHFRENETQRKNEAQMKVKFLFTEIKWILYWMRKT